MRPSSKPVEKASDDVTLSVELRLADHAVRAAALSGDVRPLAVERARHLMQSGVVGNDLEKLADRIIDSLIQSRDDHT